MTHDMDKFLNNLNEEEQKEFFKNCFYIDIKSKTEKRYPYRFIILHRQFSQKEVRYASKRYLDNYANEDEINLYYNSLNRYIASFSTYTKNIYNLYKKAFDLFINNDYYSINFLNLVRKFKCDFETLLEYPSRFDAFFANREEREKFKNIRISNDLNYIKMNYYYNFCQNQKWNYESIYTLSLLAERPIPYILKMCNEYAINYLGSTKLKEVDELINRYYFKPSPSSELIKNFFIVLEKSNTEEEIVNCFSNVNLDLNLLLDSVYNYIAKYKQRLSDSEKQILSESLKSKIKKYQEYLILEKEKKEKEISQEYDKKRQNELIYMSKKTVLKFVNQDLLNKESFCKVNGISVVSFDEMLSIIKTSDHTLYEKVKKREITIKDKQIEQTLQIIKKMINQIMFGIEEENYRSFDLLDYFIATKLSFSEVLKVCKGKITEFDYDILNSFIMKNRNLTMMNDEGLKEALEEIKIFGIEFDLYNKPILGTGHLVTYDEKIEVVNDLIKSGIPLYYQVYQIALKRKITKKIDTKTKVR